MLALYFMTNFEVKVVLARWPWALKVSKQGKGADVGPQK